MNAPYSVVDTSMETLETYGTVSTAHLQRKTVNCPTICRPSRRCFPNLLDKRWTSSSSSSSSSCSSSSSSISVDESYRDSESTFLPWDEFQHQAIVAHQRTILASSSLLTQSKCASSTCAACRSPALPRFVTAPRGPSLQCFAPPKRWWEHASSVWTSAWADQWDDWLAARAVGTCGTNEQRFWQDMEDTAEDGSSLLLVAPYDEKDDDNDEEDDPRYASF